LEARGIKPRFLVVIAAHTAGSIDSVYEFLRDRGSRAVCYLCSTAPPSARSRAWRPTARRSIQL
jgi:hypothetical protein